ncbi:FAD-dependent oxidoreductase [Halorarum salinum]|uniref:FAD-dependent oxidoreductase n=1 Tax=Halorarum salinum TaxID=2743089 RepID=A0A7D5QGD2_9EURY|nr:FAD-dependent oxidoreductase [Halobaculum salinum]QLG62143.1 FAD-dependent oxidoreductase [Halobaculum salinum]
MSDPFVVVGGDAAGLSGASKCARESDREVVVFERGRWVSYAHCGTPYYVKGEVESLLDLTSLSPAEIEGRGIDLRREHEVTGVDVDAGTVTVRSPDGTVEQPYGDLLIGTGARAVDPFGGADLDGAFTLHHLDSAAAMRAFLRDPGTVDPASVGDGFVDEALVGRYAERDPPERAVIVGGGYVGVELAEAFSAWDLDVHLFQRGDRLLHPFGEAVGEAVADELRKEGVTLHLDTPVAELRGDGDGRLEAVVCEGEERETELAVVGVGVEPNGELAAGAGVALGDSGAVAVDEYGETSVPNVYAAGDCAEDRHAVTDEPAWVPLGLTANRAGRAIGATVAGDPTPVGRIAGTAVVKAFDRECGRAGILDHGDAREAGFDPVSETITAGSRSGYYPGNAETTVTLCADRGSGRLLGGSVVGTDRAAVRIDTVATALEAGMTVGEVERLDLAYAPPFSPVWDPVLVAAKVLNGTLAEA